ncbi:MAG: Flp pilus assembly protein CpaB [Deltaproteobacteria bacterium]|nr:Flp pilus assembly protein CpaB [Deltaproteobacteria bacterium]MBL7204712.1 Flp pilus assembly protein CpaB [Desulfobacteraceae bacterium]
MGKWKAVIPFVLALAIALFGSIFLYKWIRVQTMPKEVVKVAKSEAVPVVVALADMAWGTKLKTEMLKTLPFFKESLPPGYFSDPKKIEGRVIITLLKQNEPVTESRLAAKDVTIGGISAIVKPGKRAVSVKGDKVIGIAGFINPGNRVDVLVTLTDTKTKNEVTKIVLENILVLATGTQVQNDGKGKPAPVDVYTLEVTPEEGEKLGLAATKGKIQLALRNTTDVETVLTKGATISQTLASFSKGESKPPAKKTTDRSRIFTVEIIKGGEVIKKKFKL